MEFVRTGPCLIVVGSPGVDRDIPGLRKALTHTSFFQPGPTMHKNRYHDVLFRRETVKGISAVIQIKMLWSDANASTRRHTALNDRLSRLHKKRNPF